MKKMNKLKRTINSLLAVVVLTVGTSGCVKIWEDIYIETHTCPQVDTEPVIPDWEGSESITVNE